MKMRNKGKVHPSPSSSSSSSSSSPSCNGPNRIDASAVLKLLPAAILALVSVLSMEDKDVFAYMVTKSLKSGPNSFPVEADKKKNSKKLNNTHKPPVFDCDCFDCYTSFWYRWDSSPNRELIHQAIEAFEEHLESEQASKKAGRGRKREKFARRGAEKPAEAAAAAPDLAEIDESFIVVESEHVDTPVAAAAALGQGTAGAKAEVVQTAAAEVEDEEEEEEASAEAVVMMSPPAGNSSHKGFARKMLPDVVGLLNSRLWSLWSPNA